MARLLLGVTAGIAAYKALELSRLATKAGHKVRVIQTEASTRFVGTASFAAITGAPVLLTEWEPDPLRGAFPGDPPPAHAPLSHLQLAETADVFAIAPATANTLAKLAAGQADNLLCAAALACRRPLVLAPAMNDAMYEHAATQANLATLRARGAIVLEPGTGALGSPGEWGIGRLPEPPALLAAIEAALGARPGGDLDGFKVLVTAGGTREPIDAVRFIGNRSSGRMGFALADEAARRGADVTVVAANVALPRDPAVRYIDVESAAELGAATAAEFGALRPVADGGGRRRLPAHDPARGQDQEERGGTRAAPGTYRGRALRPRRAPPHGTADRRLRRRDRRGRARVRPRQARRQGARRGRRQRRRAGRNRLRLVRQRGDDPHRGAGAARAARDQDRDRGARSSTPS